MSSLFTADRLVVTTGRRSADQAAHCRVLDPSGALLGTARDRAGVGRRAAIALLLPRKRAARSWDLLDDEDGRVLALEQPRPGRGGPSVEISLADAGGWVGRCHGRAPGPVPTSPSTDRTTGRSGD